METQFYVTGMHCGGCIKKAKDALGQVPGYEDAEFNLQEGTAVIKGDIDPQAAAHALTAIGYPSVVKSA